MVETHKKQVNLEEQGVGDAQQARWVTCEALEDTVARKTPCAQQSVLETLEDFFSK